MHILRDNDASCTIFEATWPSLCEMMLRNAQPGAPYRAAMAHLALCPACAETFSGLLALIAWREAQIPFNVGSLPLSARCQPNISLGGVSGDPTAS